jgi:hypothetical protein
MSGEIRVTCDVPKAVADHTWPTQLPEVPDVGDQVQSYEGKTLVVETRTYTITKPGNLPLLILKLKRKDGE